MTVTAARDLGVRRLRSIHRTMSWIAFERLPRRLGWKHEYYDGKAHITPGHCVTTLELAPLPLLPGRSTGIRRLTRADGARLEVPYLRAFARTPEYAGMSPQQYVKAASEYFAGFFGDVRGQWSPVSVVAEVRGEVIGGALVKQRTSGPLLDCLFVCPRHARRGWATALVTRIVQGLRRRGEKLLRSFVHLGNEESLAWHGRFGFRERPDLWVAMHRSGHYAQECQRLRRLKSPAAEVKAADAMADYWWAEVQRLRELERHEPGAAWADFE